MMSLRVLLLVSVAVAVVFAKPEDKKYTTKYDNVDVDDLLRNDRLLKRAFGCLMDEGGCTPDITELKKVLPDALQNECSKCSEKQREGAKKVLKFLWENKRSEFDKLEKKYDPEGVYRNQYKELAEKEGVKVE